MDELAFIIHSAEEGGYWAEAEGVSITTQAETLDELAQMIRDAVAAHYFDEPESRPAGIVWRFAGTEVAA